MDEFEGSGGRKFRGHDGGVVNCAVDKRVLPTSVYEKKTKIPLPPLSSRPCSAARSLRGVRAKASHLPFFLIAAPDTTDPGDGGQTCPWTADQDGVFRSRVERPRYGVSEEDL